jgi:hypothetical protein
MLQLLPLAPGHHGDDYSDGSTDADSDDAELTIGQRLARPRRATVRLEVGHGSGVHADVGGGAHPHANATVPVARTNLRHQVPDGMPFIIYICAGDRIGDGSVEAFLRPSGVHVLSVDTQIGGYAQDLLHEPVRAELRELASFPLCIGIISSVPCGSWSVLRYVDNGGPSVARRLPLHARGIPRPDGSLPPSVVKGNSILDLSLNLTVPLLLVEGLASSRVRLGGEKDRSGAS